MTGGFLPRRWQVAALREGATVRLLRSVASVGVGDALAKVLAFAYFALAARLLSASEFGTVRFAISAGLIGTSVVAPGTLAMTWFIADSRGNPEAQRQCAVTSTWIVLTAAVLSTAAVGATAFVAGERWAEVALVTLGLSASYYYLQYLKGFEKFGQSGLFPVLSNVAQLALAGLAVTVANLRGATWMVFAYAGSYWLAILIMERGIPSAIRGSVSRFRRDLASRIIRFSAPLVVRHGAYTLLFGLDLILVERLSNTRELSLYSATKTMATLYLVAPYAVFSVLMPRTAASHSRGFSSEFWVAVSLTFAASSGLLLLSALFGGPIMSAIFGAAYRDASLSLVPVGAGMTVYGLAILVDSVLSGRGQPQVLGYATVLGLIAAVPYAVAFIPAGGQRAAGIGLLVGVVVTTILVTSYALVQASWIAKLRSK